LRALRQTAEQCRTSLRRQKPSSSLICLDCEAMHFTSHPTKALYQGMALAVPMRIEKRDRALAPAMARPDRNAYPDKILSTALTFFATTKTSMGRRVLQSERNAELLI